MPTVFGHTTLVKAIDKILSAAADHDQLGKVFIECTFIRPQDYSDNWVKGSRIPDLLFIRAHRLHAYKANTPNWQHQPLILIPDMVIEIASDSDRRQDMHQKARTYLEDGVDVVWIVYPRPQQIVVYQTTHAPSTLQAQDTLIAADVIPALQVTVQEIVDQL